ncbi:MAG TPA: hypothetical protein VIG30_07955 [Ktedonobacterales bacterium]
MYEPTGDPKHPLRRVQGVRVPWRRVVLRNQVDAEPTRLRWVLLRVGGPLVAIVILLGCGVGSILITAAQQGDAPAALVRSFCADEVSQLYNQAYSLTTPDATGQTSDQFAQWSQQRDQQLGSVQRCANTGRNYLRLFGPDQAAFSLSVTFAKGTAATGVISVYDVALRGRGGVELQPPQWAIGTCESQLHLSL